MQLNRFVIRLLDIVFSGIGIIILFPLLSFIAFLIWLEDFGNPIFTQVRIGRNSAKFKIFKFRSMRIDNVGPLITSANDTRITKIGRVIRKFKLDELPQLFNVFIGNMSLVGPRPEVEHYVKHYTVYQLNILTVKPGVTDYASLIYKDENSILAKSDNQDSTYIDYIMPRKIRLNLIWVNNYNVKTYLDCIFRTLWKIFS